VFVEHWVDAEALLAHFRVPASGAFVQEVSALAASAPEISIYEARALFPVRTAARRRHSTGGRASSRDRVSSWLPVSPRVSRKITWPRREIRARTGMRLRSHLADDLGQGHLHHPGRRSVFIAENGFHRVS